MAPKAHRFEFRLRPLDGVRFDKLEKVAIPGALGCQNQHQLRQQLRPVETFEFWVKPDAPTEIALQLFQIWEDLFGRKELCL